ncbi:hypothetical protein [Emticicia fontis]
MSKEEVINYLELIATKHKSIRHNPDTAQKFGYFEDLDTEAMKKLKIRQFCMLPYQQVMQVRISDNGKEQYFANLVVHFEVSKAIPNAEDYKSIKQAQIDAYKICESIWRKMLHDERDMLHIFQRKQVRFDSAWSFNDVEGGYENMAGCDMKFTLKWQVAGIDDEYDISNDFDN